MYTIYLLLFVVVVSSCSVIARQNKSFAEKFQGPCIIVSYCRVRAACGCVVPNTARRGLVLGGAREGSDRQTEDGMQNAVSSGRSWKHLEDPGCRPPADDERLFFGERSEFLSSDDSVSELPHACRW